jgi:hypothetical protein
MPRNATAFSVPTAAIPTPITIVLIKISRIERPRCSWRFLLTTAHLRLNGRGQMAVGCLTDLE